MPNTTTEKGKRKNDEHPKQAQISYLELYVLHIRAVNSLRRRLDKSQKDNNQNDQ